MSHHSELVSAGGSSAIQFPEPVVAVTLGPDSLCDACEVQGQLLTEGGIVYLNATSQVAVRKARNRYHAEGSQGALVSLVGWRAGEAPAPVRRDRWRYYEQFTGAPLAADPADPLRILPAYGRRNLRAGFTSTYSVTAPNVVLQMVAYYGAGVARVIDRQLVSLEGFNIDDEFGITMDAIVNGAADDGYLLPTIVRGCGDQNGGTVASSAPGTFASVPLACDEVWVCLASGGDATKIGMLVELW